MTKKTLSIIFCSILVAFGALFLYLGFSEAHRVSSEDELVVSTHMLLTVPGLMGIGSGLLCLTRKSYRSGAKFVFVNLLYTLLGGFLLECIYFQFIHYGISQGQPKLALVAAGASVAYSIFYMILHIIYTLIYKRMK